MQPAAEDGEAVGEGFGEGAVEKVEDLGDGGLVVGVLDDLAVGLAEVAEEVAARGRETQFGGAGPVGSEFQEGAVFLADGDSPGLTSCPSPEFSISSASSPGTPLMSPKSIGMSPTSALFASSPPKMISRTMSFLDVRSSGLAREEEPRKLLRSATVATSGSDTRDIGVKNRSAHKHPGSTIFITSLHTSDAATRLDRMFFSYLGKLFVDLVDLKLRARRHASVANNAGGEAKDQHCEERQASNVSDSSSTSSSEEEGDVEEENDLDGSFIIESDD